LRWRPGGAQPVGLLGDAERLALEALERAVGQDHRVARDLGKAVELHRDRLVLALVQRDDLAAVAVVLAHRRAQVGEELRRGVGVGRDGLELQRGATPRTLAARDDQRHRDSVALREVHPHRHAAHDAPVADLDRHALHGRLPDRPGHAHAGDDVGQSDAAERRMARAVADDLGIDQDGVERELEVGVVGGRELGDRRRQRARIGAKVLAQLHRER
jgi:hypothetical protein